MHSQIPLIPGIKNCIYTTANQIVKTLATVSIYIQIPFGFFFLSNFSMEECRELQPKSHELSIQVGVFQSSMHTSNPAYNECAGPTMAFVLNIQNIQAVVVVIIYAETDKYWTAISIVNRRELKFEALPVIFVGGHHVLPQIYATVNERFRIRAKNCFISVMA